MNNSNYGNVPHLATAMVGPLYDLERHLLTQQIEIETWLRKEWQKTPAPITSSVDLRNAGFKLAPVDTNLFPAGYNNLSTQILPLCIQAVQSTLEKTFPGCERILLIPENHSRNLFYFENLASLQEIFTKAGFDVRIGSLLPDLDVPLTVDLSNNRKIILEPVIRDADKIKLVNFSPCLILLNNDLTSGIPPILENINQPICPAVELGWWSRLKSIHFRHYEAVATEFAARLDIDPWLINPLYRNCGSINFVEREGEECLAEQVTTVLNEIQNKYREYNIQEKPFVIVKADAGTYGMGVMSIDSPQQIFQLNRKQRNRMSALKGNQPINKVLVQEGVYSFERWGQDKAVAEPVVYMIGHHVVGGFYRMHKDRGPTENLNAPGMEFEPLAFAEACNYPCQKPNHSEESHRFYAYGVVARLALLAAARELKDVKS
jgi:glutamate--cysteine ligase